MVRLHQVRPHEIRLNQTSMHKYRPPPQLECRSVGWVSETSIINTSVCQRHSQDQCGAIAGGAPNPPGIISAPETGFKGCAEITLSNRICWDAGLKDCWRGADRYRSVGICVSTLRCRWRQHVLTAKILDKLFGPLPAP